MNNLISHPMKFLAIFRFFEISLKNFLQHSFSTIFANYANCMYLNFKMFSSLPIPMKTNQITENTNEKSKKKKDPKATKKNAKPHCDYKDQTYNECGYMHCIALHCICTKIYLIMFQNVFCSNFRCKTHVPNVPNAK